MALWVTARRYGTRANTRKSWSATVIKFFMQPRQTIPEYRRMRINEYRFVIFAEFFKLINLNIISIKSIRYVLAAAMHFL